MPTLLEKWHHVICDLSQKRDKVANSVCRGHHAINGEMADHVICDKSQKRDKVANSVCFSITPSNAEKPPP